MEINEVEKTVEAGQKDLQNYHFVSEELDEKATLKQPALMAADADDEGDKEQKIKFRLNQTGNIYYAVTSNEMTEATKKLFDSVVVLFAAMTTALAQADKTLFDYDAWGKLIRSSGYFVEIQKMKKHLTIKSNTLSVDTQIVQQLLPGITSGSSMDIAKGVLSALNGEFSASQTTEDTKIAHTLFICEELFGAPSVTVRLFFASKKSHESITQSPCHKTVSTTIDLDQEANTFLFVSPETIAEFASRFSKVPEDYTNLIKKLSELIKA